MGLSPAGKPWGCTKGTEAVRSPLRVTRGHWSLEHQQEAWNSRPYMGELYSAPGDFLLPRQGLGGLPPYSLQGES